MNYFYKFLIVALIFFGIKTSFAGTSPANYLMKETVLQEKPKPKEEKTEKTDSPLTVMFRELLGYIYNPAISEPAKTDKMASSGKEVPPSKTQKKSLP
ncbi:MAG: hypothetical protein SF052_02685 [Bacteroidia bacterium]|nr:hypothetical protein [Bacteroidia bacterium]